MKWRGAISTLCDKEQWNYKMNAASLLLSKSPVIYLVTYPNQKHIGNKILGNPVQPE